MTVKVDMNRLNEIRNDPEPDLKRVVIEGIVQPVDRFGDVRRIHGRTLAEWNDLKAENGPTTITPNGYLTSFCGDYVRVTIERIPERKAC